MLQYPGLTTSLDDEIPAHRDAAFCRIDIIGLPNAELSVCPQDRLSPRFAVSNGWPRLEDSSSGRYAMYDEACGVVGHRFSGARYAENGATCNFESTLIATRFSPAVGF